MQPKPLNLWGGTKRLAALMTLNELRFQMLRHATSYSQVALTKRGLSKRLHTKSKGCLSAFLWFHPWINRLKQIVRNRCCVMRRSNLSCICSVRHSSCLWGTEILVCQSSACNFQKGKIIPCQTDLTLKCRGQLRSVLLCINLCRVRIKCWMSHVCRIWFIWPWHLNP